MSENSNALRVLANELVCVERQVSGCDRECKKCDLCLPDSDIISAYKYAINTLSAAPTQEKWQMVAVSSGRGKYKTWRVWGECPRCGHCAEDAWEGKVSVENEEVAEMIAIQNAMSSQQLTNFCPDCGLLMREVDEETEWERME